MLVSPAFAQDAAAGGTAAVVMQVLPLVLIFAVFYFLLIRPQQKKQREHRELLTKLKRGDRVLTAGGVIGQVTRVKNGEDEIEVETAPNARVNGLRQTTTDTFNAGAANGKSEAAKS